MLLYSLPASFENFRCDIESFDFLPASDTLRVKKSSKKLNAKQLSRPGLTTPAPCLWKKSVHFQAYIKVKEKKMKVLRKETMHFNLFRPNRNFMVDHFFAMEICIEHKNIYFDVYIRKKSCSFRIFSQNFKIFNGKFNMAIQRWLQFLHRSWIFSGFIF